MLYNIYCVWFNVLCMFSVVFYCLVLCGGVVWSSVVWCGEGIGRQMLMVETFHLSIKGPCTLSSISLKEGNIL